MKNSKIIPEKIKLALAYNEMSQVELAKKAGISREYLNTICTGKNRRKQNGGTIRLIADVLGVVPEYLTGETEYMGGEEEKEKDKHFYDSVRFRANWSKIQVLLDAYFLELKIDFKAKTYILTDCSGNRVLAQDAPLDNLQKVYDSFLPLYEIGLNILSMASIWPDNK
ncbi:MAG: helix-turn-helix transcriptional regulator [Lachnospiraceae bacterium]|nr:helix-turn-helix transcriptional regulator [Lachnospiraceae bacterium]